MSTTRGDASSLFALSDVFLGTDQLYGSKNLRDAVSVLVISVPRENMSLFLLPGMCRYAYNVTCNVLNFIAVQHSKITCIRDRQRRRIMPGW